MTSSDVSIKLKSNWTSVSPGEAIDPCQRGSLAVRVVSKVAPFVPVAVATHLGDLSWLMKANLQAAQRPRHHLRLRPPKLPPCGPPFGTLRSQIDRLLEDFTRGVPSIGRSLFDEPASWDFGSLGLRVPAVDVVEKDDKYMVTAELPGLTDKDIEVTLRDDVLTVKGEKSSKRDEKKDNVRISERQYGSFQRTFRLPGDADGAKIAANVDNGVLEVTIPKSAGAKGQDPQDRHRQQIVGCDWE